ncbi:hypothetical protein QOZ99_001642 [Angulomicrobium amanitiforme]|uniref:Uncharacterized protein n=1 Tax=Ancylobacter amanitiformis TaxID=217069 RepID=A0ABU0LPW9_9HYPH|nr:hypothetical protein [Ancylobacter amanitiformis]
MAMLDAKNGAIAACPETSRDPPRAAPRADVAQRAAYLLIGAFTGRTVTVPTGGNQGSVKVP